MNPVRLEFEVRVSTPKKSGFGRVSFIDGSGVIVDAPVELVGGDKVELEIADSRLYGRVVHSEPTTSSFQFSIQVSRVALGDTELAGILQRVLLERLPDIQGLDSRGTQFD